MKELQANTTAAMNYLNQNKDRPVSDAYKQYLEKNAEAGYLLRQECKLMSPAPFAPLRR